MRLSFDCDNACVFCAQAPAQVEQLDAPNAPDAPDIAEQLEGLREQADELTFIGGEPCLDPRLPALITDARARGFRRVGVQTNANACEPEALAAAGLTDLHLSIHGPDAATHDYHSDHPGSFAANMALLSRAQRAGLRVVVATVLTRSNFRELAKLPTLLKPRGVAAWLLEFPRPYGRAAEHFPRVVPRLGMAVPYALHALELARRNDLPAWIRGVPRCTLGPFARVALPDAPRSYAPACEPCAMRPRCCGVDAAYLEAFGARELTARAQDIAPAEDPHRGALTRMFVGVGALVEWTPAKADTGGGKHRRLPVLAHSGGPEPQ
nr:radical SAM protein [Pseudenhygromyxa sp. WMMC2535]